METTFKVKVPYWAKDIKDEGLLTFIALNDRINRRYGFDQWYNFYVNDVHKIIGNNTKLQRRLEPYYEDIRVAHPFSKEVQVKVPHVRKHDLVSVPITSHRQQLVWVYLLGCLNNNLLDEEHYGVRPPSSSALTNEDEHRIFKYYG